MEIWPKFTIYLNIHIKYFVLGTVLGPADVKMNKPQTLTSQRSQASLGLAWASHGSYVVNSKESKAVQLHLTKGNTSTWFD